MRINNHFLRKQYLTLILSLCLGALPVYGQDDLLDMLEGEEKEEASLPVSSTFKGTRLINGQSVETRAKGALDFIISHRFGTLNSGIQNLYGLDDANIRLGLDYAITDRFSLGIGRSSFQKVVDGFLKYKLLAQTAGFRSFPFTLVAYTNMSIHTLPWANPERDYRTFHRYSYTHQLLMARKFSSNFSLQLMPSLIHRNLVPTTEEDNMIYALGIGGRQKITKRVALTCEYYYQFNNESLGNYHNPIAIGFDIETGGHVFQLHFTNARPTYERGFITETTGNFFEGDIQFGFNIVRTFQLIRPQDPVKYPDN